MRPLVCLASTGLVVGGLVRCVPKASVAVTRSASMCDAELPRIVPERPRTTPPAVSGFADTLAEILRSKAVGHS